MPPAEDARLLLNLVQRHLRSLEASLRPEFPEEDWGFTAQQAVEKLLKAWIVIRDGVPPRSHDLLQLCALADVELPDDLMALQTFAVEARYEEGPFPLPADRHTLLHQIRALADRCERDCQGAEA